MKRTSPKVTNRDFSPDVRREIAARSGGRCEAGIQGVCTGYANHVHHILRRSQGGLGVLSNGLHVCSECHGWIHSHVKIALSMGWLLRSTQREA